MHGESPEYFNVAAHFGAAKIGAVAVPVNPFARSSDYIHYLENSEPRAAIIHSNALAEFSPASSVRPQTLIVIVGDKKMDSNGAACARWNSWTAAASEQLAAANTSPHDPAFMLYTSGSGGTPKAAVHLHADMVVASLNHAQCILGLRAEDVTFSASKLFFAYGLGNGMYFPLSVGAGTIINKEKTKVERVLEIVARGRPTIFFSSVRKCVTAGETLPAEIFNAWKRQFGIEILDGMASTEMLHIFISSVPGKCKQGSFGFPVL